MTLFNSGVTNMNDTKITQREATEFKNIAFRLKELSANVSMIGLNPLADKIREHSDSIYDITNILEERRRN